MLPAVARATALDRARQSSTDKHLVALWLHGRPAHTQRAYRADVTRFLAFVATPLATVTLGHVQAFADSLTGLGTQLQVAQAGRGEIAVLFRPPPRLPGVRRRPRRQAAPSQGHPRRADPYRGRRSPHAGARARAAQSGPAATAVHRRPAHIGDCRPQMARSAAAH
jgi:hypothetical protein